MRDLEPLWNLGADQHGVVARSQATALGISRDVLARLLRTGELRQLTPRVLAHVSAPQTSRQAVMAAVLDAPTGAVASHQTALGLWDLPGMEIEPPQVLVPRGGRARTSTLACTRHTTRRLPDHHVTRLDGIPVTTPTRALFDISWFVHPLRLERLIDTAWSRRLTSGPLLYRTFRDLQSRGRPLMASMRALLDVRGEDYIPPESGLEARFQEIIAADGQERMIRQVDTGDDDRWLGRMDFRDRTLPLVVQIDSDRYHAALVDQRTDEAQRTALEAAGYVVRRVKEFDIWHRRDRVCADLRAARREARTRLAAA